MGKKIEINSVDSTHLFTPWGYTVSYKKIQGNNKGYMQDGSYTDDVLAYKAVFSVACMPLTDEELTSLIQNLHKYTYPLVDYYDTKTGAYRTAQFLFTLNPATERGIGSDGKIRWTGASVTFEER